MKIFLLKMFKVKKLSYNYKLNIIKYKINLLL